MTRLLDFYTKERATGGDFDAGIEGALRFMLVHPRFLYRVEQDPVNVAPAANYRISDLELASRLSFFIWSSIPDEELSGVATAGRLQNPAVLEQQVRRMLKDERARALGSNFAGQWLYLRNLRGLQPDADVYPDFDHNLREALQRETEMLFESIVLEDRAGDHAAQRGLHVPQRTSGAPLRRAEHLRHTIPPGRGDGRGAQGSAGSRQHAGADVAEQPHIAGAARQIRADEHSRDAATVTPGCGAAARRESGKSEIHARSHGRAPEEPGLLGVPQTHGSHRFGPRELRWHWPLADDG